MREQVGQEQEKASSSGHAVPWPNFQRMQVAGALSAAGASLEEVAAAARKTAESMATLGVALKVGLHAFTQI